MMMKKKRHSRLLSASGVCVLYGSKKAIYRAL